MAPLSREIAGLILPYNSFGSHLDDNGNTVDDELEKKNFQQAGEILAEIWSKVVVDGCPTVSEYIISENSEMKPSDILQKDEAWFSTHDTQDSEVF